MSREPTTAQRVVFLAKMLEDQAVEVGAVANRLRNLGITKQADKAQGLARQIAAVSHALCHEPRGELYMLFRES
jgi:hypothetical protein